MQQGVHALWQLQLLEVLYSPQEVIGYSPSPRNQDVAESSFMCSVAILLYLDFLQYNRAVIQCPAL